MLASVVERSGLASVPVVASVSVVASVMVPALAYLESDSSALVLAPVPPTAASTNSPRAEMLQQ